MIGLELWHLGVAVAGLVIPAMISIARLYARVGSLERAESGLNKTAGQVFANTTAITTLGVKVDHLEHNTLKVETELMKTNTELTSINVRLMEIQTTLREMRRND